MKITFVGDIFPANLPYNRCCGVASLDLSGKKRLSYSKRLKEIFDGSDLTVGNLESPILPKEIFSPEEQFAGNENFIKLMRESGVDIVSLANNHIFEHGIDGLFSTQKFLDDYGIKYIGLNDDSGKPKALKIHKDGLSLVFVAYNAIDNHQNKDKIISEYNRDEIVSYIKSLHETNKYDYIFLILHWGDEYIHRPSAEQINDAHSFIEAGANYIICSHPHVIQPIERYKNGLICYSLGNFIFDMTIPSMSKIGMIMNLNLEDKEFSYKCEYVRIGKDFFPSLLKDCHHIENFLKGEESQMEGFNSSSYHLSYNKEKKKKRLKKRILEKYLLIKNWHQYSPEVKKVVFSLYAKKIIPSNSIYNGKV